MLNTICVLNENVNDVKLFKNIKFHKKMSRIISI